MTAYKAAREFSEQGGIQGGDQGGENPVAAEDPVSGKPAGSLGVCLQVDCQQEERRSDAVDDHSGQRRKGRRQPSMAFPRRDWNTCSRLSGEICLRFSIAASRRDGFLEYGSRRRSRGFANLCACCPPSARCTTRSWQQDCRTTWR
jgi:hypothetical protein